MKILSVLTLFTLGITMSACSTHTTTVTPEKPIGMANPASVYCEKIGGKSMTQKDAQGAEFGVCQLPNGQMVDEWELFRANNK